MLTYVLLENFKVELEMWFLIHTQRQRRFSACTSQLRVQWRKNNYHTQASEVDAQYLGEAFKSDAYLFSCRCQFQVGFEKIAGNDKRRQDESIIGPYFRQNADIGGQLQRAIDKPRMSQNLVSAL